MSAVFFTIWVFIALIQIAVFAFYMGKSLSQNKTNLQETVDTFPICVYNGMAYWYEKGFLYRTKYKARGMRFDDKERVDQLESKDLLASDIISIINELEEAKT